MYTPVRVSTLKENDPPWRALLELFIKYNKLHPVRRHINHGAVLYSCHANFKIKVGLTTHFVIKHENK